MFGQLRHFFCFLLLISRRSRCYVKSEIWSLTNRDTAFSSTPYPRVRDWKTENGYLRLMGAYQAKLIGESDGHSETRNFEDKARAMSWLRRDGLAEHFSDQTARGELYEHGQLKWRKSGLQAAEQAYRDAKVAATRLFAELNLVPKSRK